MMSSNGGDGANGEDEGANDAFRIDAAAMRELGYRAVDLAVELLAAPGPVVRRAMPAAIQAAVSSDTDATPFSQLLAELRDDILPYRARVDHAGYLAFIPGTASWPGALGDLLASALNLDTCWWLGAAGPSQLELVVAGWFRDWIGFPEEAAGILVGGGSAGNITGLACARESRVGAMRDDLVIYASDQTHSSNARAARLLGFRSDQMRILPCDRSFRLAPDVLLRAIAADRAAGRQPFALVANAGTTNSGAVDPLEELATICAAEDVWLHVDAAYGGFAVLDPRGRAALAGLERADSVTLDPHKWLFQPFECGAVLVRDGALLERAFAITPDYLRDADADEGEVNFSDRGLQLTRSCRALKVWLSVRTHGLAAFRHAIGASLDLAEQAALTITAAPELELLSGPSLGVVAFRRVAAGLSEDELDGWNAALVEELEREGDVFVSSTRLHGRYAVRLCILNPATTWAEVEHAIAYLAAATRASGPMRVDRDARHPPIDRGWAGRSSLDGAMIRSIALFDDAEEEAVEALLSGARVREVAPGQTVVEVWDASREIYGVLDGVLRVVRGGRDVAVLAPGDHFGELAALDWGAGYGSARVATVEAMTSSRLLVIGADALAVAMRRSAALTGRVEAGVRERRRLIGGG